MDIKSLAVSITKTHRSRNPFEIIKGMNVILVLCPLEDIRGFYQYFQRNNIIYIDENLPRHEQMFVCAHELGHMLLHKKSNAMFMDTSTYLNTSHFEIEANKFALELLISDVELLENWQYTTGQLSRMFGYNEKLIELRLKD